MNTQPQLKKSNGNMVEKKKRTYFKYLLRSIKNDLVRLLTITAITALGMGFLVGLLSTSPDLEASMDSYYDETNFNDLVIRSTIGFSSDTDEYILSNISDVSYARLAHESDQFIEMNNRRAYAHLSYRDLTNNDINTLEIIEGRMPNNSNECVALNNHKNASLEEYSLNDIILINNEEIRIVGKVNDPNYITYQSETSLTTGNALEAILYLDINDYPDLPYSVLYVNFTRAERMNSFSSEYENYVSEKADEIDAISEDLINLRIEEIRSENYETIYDMVYQEAYNVALEQVVTYLVNLGQSEESARQIAPTIMAIIVTTDDFNNQVNEAVETALDSVIETLSPSWYILNRDTIPSAYLFKVDSDKVNTISLIFPPFFFLIAMLVTLSSINRIISKDRGIIGTFKALGYSKRKISTKYLVYGLLSSLLGVILGVMIGLFLFPYVLMNIYQSVYHLTNITYLFTAGYVFGFGGLMIGLILLVVLGTILGTLKEASASLMMGAKAPKPGKKILLERIKLLWKPLSFKYKSMFRNIFRYKKNLLMMIIGVGGCSGMLLTGFGIQDAFYTLTNTQFNQIVLYDAIASLSEKALPSEDIFLENDPLIYSPIVNSRINLLDDSSYSIELIAIEDDISPYISLFNPNHQQLEFTSDSVIISQQIANNFDIQVGDSVKINTDIGAMSINVSGIMENYVNNYLYLGSKAYENYFGQVFQESYNAFIIKANGIDSDVEAAYERILTNESVVSFTRSSVTINSYQNIINNLSSLVILIIALSGFLAAIVIYNLTDININERIREIATLRVLGYRRREVLMYILREVFFMGIIGALLGIGIGVFLNWFILTNIASVGLLFSTQIHWTSYIYTSLITIAFVVLIGFCFYPKIRRINMAESLKSIE